jgi:hypothetical protein
LHHTREIGMYDYTPSSWLTGHPLTTLWAWPQID